MKPEKREKMKNTVRLVIGLVAAAMILSLTGNYLLAWFGKEIPPQSETLPREALIGLLALLARPPAEGTQSVTVDNAVNDPVHTAPQQPVDPNRTQEVTPPEGTDRTAA